MPIQVYRCSEHGEFDVRLSFSDGVPDEYECPYTIETYDKNREFYLGVVKCGKKGVHVIKPPAGVIIEGGTDARKGR